MYLFYIKFDESEWKYLKKYIYYYLFDESYLYLLDKK